RMTELDQFVKSGKWNQTLGSEYFGTDVHHKTVGIIGMGRIGKAIAQRAHFGYDMSVLYHSRTKKPDVENTIQAIYCSLDELFKPYDFVLMIISLPSKKQGLICKREFALMDQSAIFILRSLGQTIDEHDYIYALQNNDIQAAGLDVSNLGPVEKN